jgi:hypothetical protein
MKTFTTITKKTMFMLVSASVFASASVWAESDMQLQEKALKARELSHHQGMDHAAHEAEGDETGGFRGVFFGYFPCPEKDCDGLKITLSLKQKNNYLLTSQLAKASSREYYEKGKFNWDEGKHILSLTPSKNGEARQFSIKSDSTLVQISNDGKPMPGNQERFTLQRSDAVKTRQVHIH